MKSGRLIVTSVVFLGSIVLAMACSRPSHEMSQAQIDQGNEKLAEAATIEQDLQTLKISLVDNKLPNGQVITVKTAAENADWQTFTLEMRQILKEKLSRYLALSSQVLALDAKKGFVVTHKDQVIAKRDGAYLMQKSIENFERIHGENFRPKPTASNVGSVPPEASPAVSSTPGN